MKWKVAQAKQQLSEVIRRCAREPQVIYNRERPVAAVVSAADLPKFLSWQESRGERNMTQALAELASICLEDGYELPAVPRVDRPNPLESRRKSRRKAP